LFSECFCFATWADAGRAITEGEHNDQVFRPIDERGE
jgi:hypothetical protein